MRMVPTWGTEAARGAPSHGRGAVAARSTASSEPCPYSGASGGCSTRHRRSGSADGAERRSGQTPTSATPAAPRTSPATVSSERAGRSNDLYRSLEQRYPWPLSGSCGLSAGAVRSSSPARSRPVPCWRRRRSTRASRTRRSRPASPRPVRRSPDRHGPRGVPAGRRRAVATGLRRDDGHLLVPVVGLSPVAVHPYGHYGIPWLPEEVLPRRRTAFSGPSPGCSSRGCGRRTCSSGWYRTASRAPLPAPSGRRTLNRSSARRRTAGAPGNGRTCRNHAQI